MSDRSIKFVLELFQNRCLKVFSKLSQSCRVALKLSQMFQVVLKCWPCSSQVVPTQNQRTLQGPKCCPCCSQLLFWILYYFTLAFRHFEVRLSCYGIITISPNWSRSLSYFSFKPALFKACSVTWIIIVAHDWIIWTLPDLSPFQCRGPNPQLQFFPLTPQSLSGKLQPEI